MTNLMGKVVFISGGSRGIGKAIALHLASHGAKICIAAKTIEENPKLTGTIGQTVKEIEALGGTALGVKMDIRDEQQIESAVSACINTFSKLDILINNASAISLTPTLHTNTKKFDLMQQVNGRGTFLLSRICLPHLLKSNHAHILNLSPPLNIAAKWFASHTAYTISKYNMSMCTLGMAEEFKNEAISINSLWPATVIKTDALKMIPGIQDKQLRSVNIVADAALQVLQQTAGLQTGQFFIDEEVLKQFGIIDFEKYALQPGSELLKDLFLE